MRMKDAVVTGKEDVSGGNLKSVLDRKGLPYEEFMRMMSESGRKFVKDVREDPLGMDFSAFNVDSAQMIRECRGTVYGYVFMFPNKQNCAELTAQMLSEMRSDNYSHRITGRCVNYIYRFLTRFCDGRYDGMYSAEAGQAFLVLMKHGS